MSGYYYTPPDEEEEDETSQALLQQMYSSGQYRQSYAPYSVSIQHQQALPAYTMNVGNINTQQPQRYSVDPQHILRSQYQYTASVATGQQQTPIQQQQQYMMTAQQPQLQQQHQPSYNVSIPSQNTAQQQYAVTTPPMYQQSFTSLPPGYLSPPIAGPSRPRLNRAASTASHASSVSYNTDNSRSVSPNAAEMARWGTRNRDGTWTCSYQGCTSVQTFSRGCDLRKHYKRHTKSLFCRYEGCPQSTSGGFSSKKDRLRHEQKHNPQVRCEYEDCDRRFSRVDNMKDHVRRVHQKRSTRG